MQEHGMPFGAGCESKFRDYTAGDFIFGLNDAVNTFKATHDGTKGSLTTPVTTVRQLTNVIDDIMKFDDGRFDQNYAYLDSVLNHPKYHTSVVSRSLDLSTKGQVGGEGSNEAFRRKSKGALNWLISQKQHLHFVLDKLDMEGVVTKENFKPKPSEPTTSGGHKYRDVTGAELRWIFRHKDDPNTQEAVQFWLANAQCVAPWDQPAFRDLWMRYVPREK
jgi:hypothetical protein